MNPRRRTACIRLVGILLGVLAWGQRLDAQRVVPLLTFTNSWRYETNGTDQGVAWRSRTFADTGWPVGMGLLGGFNGAIDVYPYPFKTVFPAYNDQIITYYFRAHFNMAASDLAWPLTLVMSNLVDDGCVVYLNSNEVHRIRMPAGQIIYTTPATGGPAAEGAYEPQGPPILTNGLVVGDNVIAVEVHQVGTGSSDITLGLSLTAIVPTALSITSQPSSQSTITVGSSLVLSVAVAGGPALYQWQTNNASGTFVNVLGTGNPNTSSYTYRPTAPGTVMIRVVASNGVNTVISTPATVTAIADTVGPVMLSAQVVEEVNRTNRIRITWNEPLTNTTVCAGCGTNFTVILGGSNVTVTVSNVQYNPSGGLGALPGTFLTMSTTNWHRGSNYCVIVNNVRDFPAFNVIAPNSRLPVLWPVTTNLLGGYEAWHFHTAAGFEPGIYSQPWQSPEYVESFWWAEGGGPFYGGLLVDTACVPFQTEIGFQPEPSLFRASFHWPAESPSTATLKLRYVFDDGVVFYLNGQEFGRVNVPAGPIQSSTRASTSISSPVCTSDFLPVTNLVAGRNWLAAAVAQAPVGVLDSDSAFGLELDAVFYPPRTLPSEPVPTLRIEALDSNVVRLSWTGSGYALEATTNLPASAASPWVEVTNMANPFTTTIAPDSQRFFRLRKPAP